MTKFDTNPPTVILDKNGVLRTGYNAKFRGLTFPFDLISYEIGFCELIRSETELRAKLEEAAAAKLGAFDIDATITEAMQPAATTRTPPSRKRRASLNQALSDGFLIE